MHRCKNYSWSATARPQGALGNVRRLCEEVESFAQQLQEDRENCHLGDQDSASRSEDAVFGFRGCSGFRTALLWMCLVISVRWERSLGRCTQLGQNARQGPPERSLSS